LSPSKRTLADYPPYPLPPCKRSKRSIWDSCGRIMPRRGVRIWTMAVIHRSPDGKPFAKHSRRDRSGQNRPFWSEVPEDGGSDRLWANSCKTSKTRGCTPIDGRIFPVETCMSGRPRTAAQTLFGAIKYALKFKMFVVFAEMRTGFPNFLESNLNAFDGDHCPGEGVQPAFIGLPQSAEDFGRGIRKPRGRIRPS